MELRTLFRTVNIGNATVRRKIQPMSRVLYTVPRLGALVQRDENNTPTDPQRSYTYNNKIIVVFILIFSRSAPLRARTVRVHSIIV